MMRLLLLALTQLLLCCSLIKVQAFSISRMTPSFVLRTTTTKASSPRRHRYTSTTSRPSFVLSSSQNDATPPSPFMESLRARQHELQQEQLQNWKSASCSTSCIVFPDWVRRISVDYPYIAVGSASSCIFVAHMNTGEIVAATTKEENNNNNDPPPPLNLDTTLLMMYGSYDGGGTLSIAFYNDLVVSSHRGGSIQVHRFIQENNQLIFQGNMVALQNILCTTLSLDDEYLYVGTNDGRVLMFETNDNLVLQQDPYREWNFDATILDLSIHHHSERNYAVVGTSKGSVELISLNQADDENNQTVVTWYPPFDSGRASRNVVPLSVTLLYNNNNNNTTTTSSLSLACGGSDGSIYIHPLHYNKDSHTIDSLKNGQYQLQPKHMSSCMCLCTIDNTGLLVSGGQDGTVRVWNVKEENSSLLYQFLGYKVWLGSLWSDGRRLISDGADNTVVVHDFGDCERKTKKNKDDDDDDDE